jgi:serine/threonine-protein kinase
VAARIGEIVGGRYRLRAPLGSGGMGQVYLAELLPSGERVAVKALKPELNADDGSRRRFEQEARALAAIRHPNVARFFELVLGDPTLLVTEYVEGPTLRQVIEREGRLPPARAASIAGQLSFALHAVHAAGVVHRDLKPDNVVMRKKQGGDFPKLIDFGLAKLGLPRHQRLTRAGALFGTPQYMAPEQVAGRDVDARADVYALGCVLYQMLVGHPPFPDCASEAEVMTSQVERPFTKVTELAPRTPPGLAEVLERMVAKLAGDRYPSMIEVSHALSTFDARPPAGIFARLKGLLGAKR